MHASYEAYIASLGSIDEPALILCVTKGCEAEPEDGCDHCTRCLEAIEAPTQTNLQVAA